MKKSKVNYINSVKVIVSPWQKGFHCGIIMDTKSKMTTEQYELCSTIARGMIKMATSDPHSTFLWGLRGFAEDKKKSSKDLSISSVAETLCFVKRVLPIFSPDIADPIIPDGK